MSYGLGSASRNLPGFVVLQSGPRGPRAGTALWSSGFLPTSFQGVPFRGKGDPILNLRSPQGLTRERERDFYDTVTALNATRLEQVGDPEITTRINAYEMAFRMQTSAPELIDLVPGNGRDARPVRRPAGRILVRRQLPAGAAVGRTRRAVRAAVSHRLGPSRRQANNLSKATRDSAAAKSTRPAPPWSWISNAGDCCRTRSWSGAASSAARRWAKSGRPIGRDHHVDAFTMWLAGGGVKPGLMLGETDELGFGVVEGKVHVHDLHATLLHLLGFDHEQLTYRFQGRDFRLTDVRGELIGEILA